MRILRAIVRFWMNLGIGIVRWHIATWKALRDELGRGN